MVCSLHSVATGSRDRANVSLIIIIIIINKVHAGRPGSSEVPRNPLTRWDVSSTPANGIFLTKKLKN